MPVVQTISGPDQATAGEINARLERLPFAPWHARILGVIGAAHLFDSFDTLLIGFIAPVLAITWKLSPFQIGVLFSVGYVGQFVGALAIGRIADSVGRRTALRGTLFILSLLSLACAVAPNYLALLALRLLQGIGLGGEVPVAATYMNEVAPARSRGRVLYALQMLFTSGALVAAVLSAWLLPLIGWRAMFLIGALPLVLAALLPRLVPESPRWLASKGRLAEADAIVAGIERNCIDLPAPATARAQNPTRTGRFMDLLGGGYTRRTLSLWLMMLSASLMGIGITTWLPSLYTTVFHLPLDQALRYTSVAAAGSIGGALLGFVLIDWIGRRGTFLIGFLGGALALLTLAALGNQASAQTVMVLATIGMLMTTVLLCGGYIYAPEIYPTRLRATAAGTASACLRMGAFIGPLVVGWLLEHAGISGVFLFFGLSGVVGAITTFLFALETKGKPLEEFEPVPIPATELRMNAMTGKQE